MPVVLFNGIAKVQKMGNIETKKITTPTMFMFLTAVKWRSTSTGLFLSVNMELANNAWTAKSPARSKA